MKLSKTLTLTCIASLLLFSTTTFAAPKAASNGFTDSYQLSIEGGTQHNPQMDVSASSGDTDITVDHQNMAFTASSTYLGTDQEIHLLVTTDDGSCTVVLHDCQSQWNPNIVSSSCTGGLSFNNQISHPGGTYDYGLTFISH